MHTPTLQHCSLRPHPHSAPISNLICVLVHVIVTTSVDTKKPVAPQRRLGTNVMTSATKILKSRENVWILCDGLVCSTSHILSGNSDRWHVSKCMLAGMVGHEKDRPEDCCVASVTSQEQSRFQNYDRHPSLPFLCVVSTICCLLIVEMY